MLLPSLAARALEFLRPEAVLSELVRTPSVNPSLPGGTGESDVIELVRHIVELHGVDYELREVLPGRANIVARVPGKNQKRAVLLESHLDTASALNMTIPPFDPVVKNGFLYGRGSCDTKGSAAAMLVTLLRLARAEERPPQTVYWAGVVDEEYSMKGAQALTGWIRERTTAGEEFAGIIIGEPTELEIVVAHKGTVQFQVRTFGKAAHGSAPQQGRNAVLLMSELALALEREYASGLAGKQDAMVGTPSLSIGRLEGGTQANIVPDTAVLWLDRRTIPGESTDAVLNEIDTFLQEKIASRPDMRVEVCRPPLNACAPASTDESHPFVEAMLCARAAVAGTSRPQGVSYATDGSFLRDAGVPMIVFGPGSIDQAHTEVEFLELAQLERATAILENLLSRTL